MTKIFLKFFLMVVAIISFADTNNIPMEAALTISKINSVAQQHDFKALQLLMTTDFIWSFGGDASATQAIAEWKTDPSALVQLSHVTSQPCIIQPDSTVECPSNAGLGYRAGFKLTNVGWRMHYFVQGD